VDNNSEVEDKKLEHETQLLIEKIVKEEKSLFSKLAIIILETSRKADNQEGMLRELIQGVMIGAETAVQKELKKIMSEDEIELIPRDIFFQEEY
jgi:hypothetical protein